MPSPLDVVLVFSGDSSKATMAVDKLATQVQRLQTTIKTLRQTSERTAKAGSAQFANWGKVFTAIQGSVQRAVDSFRLMSQGLMSVGRALTFFISIPLGLFLREGVTTAAEFEDQMIRVRKTAGLTRQGLEDVTEEIRKIGRSAPTSHEQLGIMAEQAGQLGITAPKSIGKFVQWMEILATSTNIASDEVVQTMGKIAAAFGWSINESVDEVVRLGNVMNQLENTTASTAGEIADALFRFAPQAAQLRIHAADAAALAASLIALGVSSESTGTRLGNMFIKMTQNSEKFAELAAGTEKYATQADVLNAINEDAVGVLHDLILMMGAEDNRARALAEAFELVGLRGGRALGTLGQNVGEMEKNLSTARREWEESASLITEYNIALQSSQNQMQIFKNNVADIGIELGKSFLPAINELIQIAVPALRMLGDAFARMENSTKLWIAAIAVLVVVLGPVMFLLSQILFGVFMMGLGIIKLVGAIGGLARGLLFLIKAVGALSSGWLLAIGAIIGGAFLLKNVFTEQAGKIATAMRALATKAKEWGENLMAELGTGIMSGAVKFVSAAVTFVANMIASFLEAKSPPELGPLSHIDKWGIALIDTYLKSMKKADFGILREVGRVIAGIFKNFALIGKVREKDEFIFLLEARQNLAELLALWRKTGKVSEAVLSKVVKNLGEASDEVAQLIRLNFKLLAAEEALIDLARRRDAFKKQNEAEIKSAALANKSAEERVEMIRRLLRERDSGLRAFDQEEKKLEDQRDIAKEQLETQKAMVDAMQEQDDIQARLIKALEKAAGAIGGMDFELPEIEPGTLGIDKIQEELEKIGEPIIELELKFASKKGVIEGFLSGLKGVSFEGIGPDVIEDLFGVSEEDYDLFQRLNTLGFDLQTTWNGFLGVLDNINTKALEIRDNLFTGIELPPNVQESLDNLSGWWSQTWPTILKWVEYGRQVLTALWEVIWARLGPAIENFREAFARAWEKMHENGRTVEVVTGFLKLLGIVIGGVILFLLNFITAVLTFALNAGAIWLNMIATILDDSVSWRDKIKAIFTAAWEGIKEVWNRLKDFLFGWWAELTAKIIEKLAPDALSDLVTTFATKLAEITTNVVTWLAELATKFGQGAADLIKSLVEGINNKKDDFIQAIINLANEAIGGINKLLDRINELAGTNFQISFIGGGFKVTKTNEKEFASGGMVLGPTRGILGEAEAEAVLPLSRVPAIFAKTLQMANMMGSVAGSGNMFGKVEVNFNNPVVRDERDLEVIVATVEKVLAEKVRAASSYGGVLDF